MRQSHDHTYIELLEKVLNHGTQKHDRTGTGTRSLFAETLRFDLSDQTIPLLTTKKMHWPSIIHEILWYLSGSGNVEYLRSNGVRIWDEWSSPEGHLNNIYGAQWRRWENANWLSSVTEIKLKPNVGTDAPFTPPDSDSNNNYKLTVHGQGCIGEYKERPVYYSIAYKLWYDMMGKCYDTSHIEYSLYGGVGIFVDQSWKCFSSFLRDIHDLPWFNRWKDEPGRISLSKDYYGADCFSKETCVFAPIEYTQMLSVLDGTKFVMTNKETGKKHECTAQQWKALHLKEDEWNIEHVYPKEGYAFRQQIVIDQLSNVVNTIRNNPDDRRIIVSAWNVGDLHQMGLPPCHYTFQFYVADKKLSCKLTQRSADMFLGVPFNIAQYAILTRMIAHITGLQAHEFIWCGGDVHLYNNHTEQAKEQIARTPYESPILKFSRPLTNIDDFQFDDFVLDNYISHPTIKAKVSV